MSQEASIAPNDVITCRVTTWYYRRMGLLATLFLGMGLYFFYDGKIGYPRDNEIAAKKQWFEETVMKDYDAAKVKGEAATAEWVKQAREKGWIVKPAVESPRWDDYAAPHGWDSKPKHHSEDEIAQQFYWGGAMILGAAIVGVMVLLSHGKVFVGHADHMLMPNGTKVTFAEVVKIDKRKWDNKGLAYVFYKHADDAQARRVVIDDLKFGGAGKVLDRLLGQFSGELIEKVLDEPESPSDEAKAQQPPKEEA